jgi:FKBP-type peptidyl-prolyl cis-trans isomerase
MQFFIDNESKGGINVVESGLQYSILSSGDQSSKSPELTDTITAHFHGTLTDGSVFWSSVEANEPLQVQLSGLIIGCQKIISLMKVNDKWRVYIDPSMAYGDEGRPGIPSNSILIFDIELLDIQ